MSKEETKEPTKASAVNAMMQQIEIRKTRFHELLPEDRGGNRAEWFLAETRVALARAPKLAHCTQMSVIDALMTCAQLGLSPSGRLGSAYLVPYKDKCTLVIGYRGYIDLAYRSGDVASFHAEVVYEKDTFVHREGLAPVLEHVRTEEDAPGVLRAVYAIATMKSGGVAHVVMLRRDVLAIKARSKTSSDGPWVTDEAEMWKKTAIRRIIKLLPLSPVNAKALYAAEGAERTYEDAIDADFTEAPARGVAGAREAVQKALAPPAAREELEFSTETRERVPVPAGEMSEAEKQEIIRSEYGPGSDG